jgi:hypothetical protein
MRDHRYWGYRKGAELRVGDVVREFRASEDGEATIAEINPNPLNTARLNVRLHYVGAVSGNEIDRWVTYTTSEDVWAWREGVEALNLIRAPKSLIDKLLGNVEVDYGWVAPNGRVFPPYVRGFDPHDNTDLTEEEVKWLTTYIETEKPGERQKREETR